MTAIWRHLQKACRRLRWKLTFSYTFVTVGALVASMLIVAVLTLSGIFLPYDQAPLGLWVQAANEQAVPLARMLLSESPPNTAGIAELANYSDRASFETLELARLRNVTLFVRATAGLEMLVFDAGGMLLGRTGEPRTLRASLRALYEPRPAPQPAAGTPAADVVNPRQSPGVSLIKQPGMGRNKTFGLWRE
jgi:hypothetical protein